MIVKHQIQLNYCYYYNSFSFCTSSHGMCNPMNARQIKGLDEEFNWKSFFWSIYNFAHTPLFLWAQNGNRSVIYWWHHCSSFRSNWQCRHFILWSCIKVLYRDHGLFLILYSFYKSKLACVASGYVAQTCWCQVGHNCWCGSYIGDDWTQQVETGERWRGGTNRLQKMESVISRAEKQRVEVEYSHIYLAKPEVIVGRQTEVVLMRLI